MILGGGVVGTNACKIAVGLGANVTILDLSAKRLQYLDDIFGTAITTLYATEANITECITVSDLVIGAVLVPGGTAPKVIQRDHLKTMKKGAVIVDVAVDQGGCCETTHPTFHSDPIYLVDGIVHYGVANMPSVVAVSATIALTSATIRYGLIVANEGIEKVLKYSKPVRSGINTYQGKLTNYAVAEDLGMVGAYREL